MIAKLLEYARLALGAVLVVAAFLLLVRATPYFLALALLFLRWNYVRNVVTAMDKFCAVLIAPLAGMSWDGSNTISSECGAQLLAGNPCFFCRTLCKVLTFFQTKHCEKYARTN